MFFRFIATQTAQLVKSVIPNAIVDRALLIFDSADEKVKIVKPNGAVVDLESNVQIHSKRYDLILDGTEGNGATGTIDLDAVAEGDVFAKYTIIKSVNGEDVGLTPDNGATNVKLTLSTDGDITSPITTEDINDYGISSGTPNYKVSTAAQTLQLETNDDISGPLTIIVESTTSEYSDINDPVSHE